MTNLQKDQIIAMREQKVTYATISEALGIPIGTIKTFCRRNSMTTARTYQYPKGSSTVVLLRPVQTELVE